jgi:TAG lipase/steryl ester hydrolase/phospholipase A2/LPA acyltransferase
MTAPAANARYTPMGHDSRADEVETIWLVEAALRLEAAIASGDGEAAQAAIETVIAQDLVMACHPAILRNRSSDYRAGVDRFSRALAAAIDAFGTILVGTDIGDRLNAASGRTALMLSGGGTLGNYHLGVVRTLLSADMLPTILSGSSAGALIAAIIGTSAHDRLDAILDDDARELSSDGHSGAREFYASPFSQARLKDMIDRLLPDCTFAEAYDRSGCFINIVVAESASDGKGRVLNATVSPDVLLREAVLASCAVPGVYPSVVLHERQGNHPPRPYADGARWMDGSIHADLPAVWLRDQCGVTHLIGSIVNPLELPLLTDPDKHGSFAHEAVSMVTDMWRSIGAMGLGLSASMMLGVQPVSRTLSIARRIVEQRVDADVIIAPAQRIHTLMQMGEHATMEQLAAFIDEGAQSTTDRLPMIAPLMRIERALERQSYCANPV